MRKKCVEEKNRNEEKTTNEEKPQMKKPHK